MEDEAGNNPDEVRREVGFEGELDEVELDEGHYHAFVELHIEQGPRLERAGVPIGVVTNIAAPATLHVTLEGQGGTRGRGPNGGPQRRAHSGRGTLSRG